MSTDDAQPATTSAQPQAKALAGMETLHLERWPQSPRVMIRARVIYLLRHLGACPVTMSAGRDPIQDSVEYIRRSQNLYGKINCKKLAKVRLEISAHCINIVQDKSSLVVNHADINNVATCGGKRVPDLDREFFVYIARRDGKFEAQVFLSTYRYQTITASIQEAFEINYYLNAKPEEDIYQSKAELHTERNLLEEENARLRKRVAELEKLLGQNPDLYQLFPKPDHSSPQTYFNTLHKRPPVPSQPLPETPRAARPNDAAEEGWARQSPPADPAQRQEPRRAAAEGAAVLVLPRHKRPSAGEESSEYGETADCVREPERLEDKVYEEIGEYYDATYLIPKRRQ